jgi:hypothetical protein
MIFLHHWYDYQKCRSKEAFRKVDFGYPQQFAAFALKNDVKISDYFIPRC